eukprot:2811691-Amphidinium_carterae.1
MKLQHTVAPALNCTLSICRGQKSGNGYPQLNCLFVLGADAIGNSNASCFLQKTQMTVSCE